MSNAACPSSSSLAVRTFSPMTSLPTSPSIAECDQREVKDQVKSLDWVVRGGASLVLLWRFVASERAESFAVVGVAGSLEAAAAEVGPVQYVFGGVLDGQDEGGE